MKLYIGADHRGFKLKDELVKELPGIEDLGINMEIFDQVPVDYRSDSDDTRLPKEADYPVIAEKIANAVVESRGQGILLCGSGQGACIAANKVDGVRAAQAWDVKTARSARHDDDANILCLGADDLEAPNALKIIKTFLTASFDPAPRRKRRLKEIKKIEKEN